MTTAASATPRRHVPEFSLGDRLRRIRRDLGINQTRFAELLGENPKTYAAWELDTSRPRDLVAAAKRVELISGVPASWVMGLYDGGESARPGTDTGVDTRGYREATSSLDEPLALVRTLPQRNRAVASTNATMPPTAEHTAIGTTRTNEAERSNRGLAA